MIEYSADIFIAGMYLATMVGMILFMAFLCRLGDLGLMFLGWLDRKIQRLL